LDIPKELRWIGPLFGGLYLILWVTQGFVPFWAVTVFSAGIIIIVPAILIQALLLLVALGVVRRYRIASGIFFLSYFCSGILIQQTFVYMPVPPPLPVSSPTPVLSPPLSILMITPSMLVINIILFFQTTYLPTILWLLFLLVLTILTPIVTGLVTDGKIDPTVAMLLYVIIIVGWTLSIIPLSIYSSANVILTPIPLGPLVALNAIPWFPSSKTNEQETIQKVV
jgi:hypothetical protein